MKTKRIIMLIWMITFITSCTPAAPSSLPEATMAVVPTATPVPTAAPTPTPNEPTKPTELIASRLDAVIASYRDLGNYPFTSTQIEHIKQSVEYAHIRDEKLNLDRYYWLISASKLTDLQEPELAEMLGFTPLTYSEDGRNWRKVGLKDASDIPIGGQSTQQGNGSMEIMADNFDFFIIPTDWGFSSFGDMAALSATGIETRRSIFDYIQIVDEKTVVLDPDPELYTWSGYTDFQTDEALKYLQPEKKGVDPALRNRRLMMLPIVYPSSVIPLGLDTLNKEQALSFIRQYVALMVNRYRDRYFAYVGVTEFGLDGDALMKQLGPEYIDVVYQTIRETDPTAVLILEHAGNEVPDTDMTKLTLDTATHLREIGLIDVIASECHIDQTPGALPDVSQAEMEQVFLGYPVPVFPSSIDINTSAYKDDPQRFLIQADKARKVVQASLNAGAPYISFWGDFPDSQSWLEVIVGDADADATPWTDSWQEKPMFFTAISVLLKNYIQANQ